MTIRRKLKISVILAGTLVLNSGGAAFASVFTARKIMKEMSAEERYSYLAGIIEGLAIARYMKDGKQKTGMQCIYDWYYDDKQTLDTIYLAFGKYPDYPPGSLIDILAKQKCGE